MARQRQTTIAGTSDDVSTELALAAENYLDAKRAVAKFREKMNTCLDLLIAQMRKEGVEEMLIDDGEKKLILTTKDLVKIKARKKKKDGDGYEDNGDE